MFTVLLKNVLGKMPMPEPEVPENRHIRLVEDEPQTEIEAEEQAEALADSISTAVFITYKNSKGEESERRISVKRVSRSAKGDLLVRAYCFERKAVRCFRADRIVEAVDLATGEVWDTQTEILECFGVVEKTLPVDPKAATREALTKCRHAMNVLVYLARCDGHFHHEEENIIIHYLMDECFDCEFHDEYLLARIRKLYPDTDSFFDSLDYLEEKNPEALGKLARYAARLVQADGEIAKDEMDFMNELQAYST
ncbi:MAG TPA: TerB family tellurite resistance protein [Alphaproteobacteria bacterium]|nr:TerB family tellurite resistance protein [Alphaproteobacteria bacterium]USO05694.1 MAG: TerB family tellurite resistance protein [Rhodospirillales bacterium]HOO81631.1 TerB family tellurite resistance protein [Alphaproteobacteria bacterium]